MCRFISLDAFVYLHGGAADAATGGGAGAGGAGAGGGANAERAEAIWLHDEHVDVNRPDLDRGGRAGVGEVALLALCGGGRCAKGRLGRSALETIFDTIIKSKKLQKGKEKIRLLREN